MGVRARRGVQVLWAPILHVKAHGVGAKSSGELAEWSKAVCEKHIDSTVRFMAFFKKRRTP